MELRSRPLWAWLFGGIPIIVSMFQAASGLMGRANTFWIPIFGSISRFATTTWDLNVAQVAVPLFYSQQALVYTLFFLILFAWVAQGVVSFTDVIDWELARLGAGGTVLLAALLYGFLFFGVYGAVLTASVPLIERLGFFAIPILVVGALGEAYRSTNWEDDRKQKALRQLNVCRSRARSQKQSFISTLDEWNVESLVEESPRIDRMKDDFVQECDSVIADADYALSRTDSLDISSLEDRARKVQAQADSLAYEAELDQIRAQLQSGIKNLIDEQFSSLEREMQSRYGEQYRVENLPRKYRTIEFETGDEITASSSPERGIKAQLTQLLTEQSLDPDQAINMLSQADTHIEQRLLPHIRETESRFHEEYEEVDENLERARKRIERIGGYTGEMLESVLITGDRADITDSARDIEDKRQTARGQLHSCDFDSAIDSITSARRMSEELLTTLQFVRSVLLPAADATDGTNSVRIPPTKDIEYEFLTPELFERLREPIRNDYGVAIQANFDQQTITLNQDGDGESESRRRSPDPDQSPTDSVLYLLREMKRVHREDPNEPEVSVQLGDVPDGVLMSKTVPELTSFIEDYEDLELVESPDDTNAEVPHSGYITVKTSDGTLPRTAFDDLLQAYRSWHSRS